jgi:hypothetical protein
MESPNHEISVALQGVIFTVLICAGVLFPLFRLAVWKRRNWARWVLLLLFVVSVPAGGYPLFQSSLPMASVGVFLVSNLVEALGFYFLFTGDARTWFK